MPGKGKSSPEAREAIARTRLKGEKGIAAARKYLPAGRRFSVIARYKTGRHSWFGLIR